MWTIIRSEIAKLTNEQPRQSRYRLIIHNSQLQLSITMEQILVIDFKQVLISQYFQEKRSHWPSVTRLLAHVIKSINLYTNLHIHIYIYIYIYICNYIYIYIYPLLSSLIRSHSL